MHDQFKKCACPHCQGHIEFPSEHAGTAIACPHCGNAFALPIKVGKPIEQKSEGFATRLLKLFLIAFIGVLIAAVATSRDSPPDEASTAYFAAVKFCERYAPSTHNFTTLQGADYLDGRAVWNTQEQAWTVNGYVDCQNVYGAMRHELWYARLRLTNGNWRLDCLEVGEETLIGTE